MAKIAMLRRHEQIGPMWETLVSYANDTPETEDVFEAFWNLICRGMDWLGVVSGEYSYESAVAYCHDSTGHSMQELANLYRPHVRNILAWLSMPEKTPVEDSREASDFLLKSTIDIRQLFSSNHNFKATPKRAGESTLLLRDPDVRLMLGGVCRFLVEQIERHDLNGEDISDVLPLRLCGRPDCGKFFTFQRASMARFCTASCRVKFNDSKMTKEARRDKMRKYRAGQKDRDAASLRAVLNSTKRTSKRGK